MEKKNKVFWLLIVIAVLAAIVAATLDSQSASSDKSLIENKTEINNTETNEQLIVMPAIAETTTVVPVETMPKTTKLNWDSSDKCGYPSNVRLTLTNPANETVNYMAEVSGNSIKGNLTPHGTKSFQISLNSNVESGGIDFVVDIIANDQSVANKAKRHCDFSGSSGSGNQKKMVSETPAITPTSTPTPQPAEDMPLMVYDISSTQGKKGENVVVAVKISNRLKTDSIYTAILEVSYNKTVLNLTDIGTGSLTSGWGILFNANKDRVSLYFEGNGTEIHPEASGEIAKLNFSIKGEPGSQSFVNITSMQVSNVRADVDEVSGTNGRVKVVL